VRAPTQAELDRRSELQHTRLGAARITNNVNFDVVALEDLRARHVAWRLLYYERAPLAIAFLHAAFVSGNVRARPEDEAAELLEDQLFALRQARGDSAAPRSAREYLVDWSSDERGFLRRFYPATSDDAHLALTSGAERAIAMIASLDDAGFVGTESRLLNVVELLRQLDMGTDPNVENRLADLRRRRDALDEEISRTLLGDVRVLDDRAVVERFQQFAALARDLLADFSAVEENFRRLDRSVRERIAQWSGAKADLLDDVFGARDAITSSDQGASFRAFWEFLMSPTRQDELTSRLERIVALPPIVELRPDRRLRRVHYDWLVAGEETQRTVALLSSQLRRFLDDKTWLENRRIIDILRSVESGALAIRDTRPVGTFHHVDAAQVELSLPMERRLASGAAPLTIAAVPLLADEDDIDVEKLFEDSAVDLAVLADQVDEVLGRSGQVTLAEVCDMYPLTAGLAELVGYLHVDDHRFVATFVDDQIDRITWQIGNGDDAMGERAVEMPRLVFVR
jgi:Protein of unknown function (DUF3375)